MGVTLRPERASGFDKADDEQSAKFFSVNEQIDNSSWSLTGALVPQTLEYSKTVLLKLIPISVLRVKALNSIKRANSIAQETSYIKTELLLPRPHSHHRAWKSSIRSGNPLYICCGEF